MANSNVSKTERSIKNALYGILHILFETLVPFLLRTALLNSLGDKYLGINNLFHSILSILSLAEIGFGEAISFCMYKPIAEKDDDKVCALLKEYKNIYRIIGTIVLVVGLSMIPFLDYFVKDGYPAEINIVFVYLIYLSEIVINYFFFAHESALLGALQRSDLRHQIFLIIEFFSYSIRFIIICFLKNYYLFILVIPLTALVIRLAMHFISKKYYPQFYPHGDISPKEKRHIKSLTKDIAIHKFGNSFSQSINSVITSSYFGLRAIAVFGNYQYIINSLLSLCNTCIVAATASVGNSIVANGREKNYLVFKQINLINSWLVLWCSSCLLVLYQPFMKLWAGEELTSSFFVAVSFTVLFYFSQIRKTVLIFKDAGGIWKSDKYKPIVSGVLNLIICLLFINKLEIASPVIATIICYVFIEIPWETNALFSSYFLDSQKKYYIWLIKNTLFTIACCAICLFVSNKIDFSNKLLLIICKGLLSFVLSNTLFILFNYNNELFKSTVAQILKVFINKRS